MAKQRGLGYTAALTGGAILAGPYVHTPWLMALVIILFSLILWRFFGTKYLAYVFCILSALYAVNLLPFVVLATTLAMISLGELVFQSGADDLNTYFYYVISTAWAGILVMVYLHEQALLMVIFGIIAAVLLKVILLKYEDSLVLEGIGIAMTMYLIKELNYTADIEIVIIAVFIAFVFGYFAYRFKTADLSGLFSTALVGIILLVFADATWFLVMLAFFILGSVCTRYKFEYKKRIGVEQGKSGARGYRNVFANGIVACAAAVLYGVFVQPVFIVMYVGCVATAAADTMASEIGVTGGIPYMITTLRRGADRYQRRYYDDRRTGGAGREFCRVACGTGFTRHYAVDGRYLHDHGICGYQPRQPCWGGSGKQGIPGKCGNQFPCDTGRRDICGRSVLGIHGARCGMVRTGHEIKKHRNSFF